MKKTKAKKKVPAPTATELAGYIGQRGSWAVPIKSIDKAKPFTILVEILDARWLFGRLEFKIRPSGGTGETWAQGVVLP